MMGGKDGNSKWHDNGAILPVKHPSKLGKEKSVLELEMLFIYTYIFYFHPYLGKISILTNIFQRG